MHRTKQDFEREFICPKCRARGAHVQQVDVGRSMAGVIAISPDRYLAVTCGLCGYTEFYNQAICVKNEETETNRAKLAEKPTE